MDVNDASRVATVMYVLGKAGPLLRVGSRVRLGMEGDAANTYRGASESLTGIVTHIETNKDGTRDFTAGFPDGGVMRLNTYDVRPDRLWELVDDDVFGGSEGAPAMLDGPLPPRAAAPPPEGRVVAAPAPPAPAETVVAELADTVVAPPLPAAPGLEPVAPEPAETVVAAPELEMVPPELAAPAPAPSELPSASAMFEEEVGQLRVQVKMLDEALQAMRAALDDAKRREETRRKGFAYLLGVFAQAINLAAENVKSENMQNFQRVFEDVYPAAETDMPLRGVDEQEEVEEEHDRRFGGAEDFCETREEADRRHAESTDRRFGREDDEEEED